jgi:hypothetical protein
MKFKICFHLSPNVVHDKKIIIRRQELGQEIENERIIENMENKIIQETKERICYGKLGGDTRRDRK